jgi:hypothetical protein
MTRLFICILFLAFTGCHQVDEHASQSKLQHIVLVWLKDSSLENKQLVMQKSKSLFEIEELLSMDMGVTLKSNRSIVDDSYDIGYIMTFNDKAAMERYLIHPVHVKLVNEVLKPSMSKVQVYDIIVQP